MDEAIVKCLYDGCDGHLDAFIYNRNWISRAALSYCDFKKSVVF